MLVFVSFSMNGKIYKHNFHYSLTNGYYYDNQSMSIIKMRHNLIVSYDSPDVWQKRAGLFHTCHRMSCVAAIEADGLQCGSFGYRTFYLFGK